MDVHATAVFIFAPVYGFLYWFRIVPTGVVYGRGYGVPTEIGYHGRHHHHHHTPQYTQIPKFIYNFPSRNQMFYSWCWTFPLLSSLERPGSGNGPGRMSWSSGLYVPGHGRQSYWLSHEETPCPPGKPERNGGYLV